MKGFSAQDSKLFESCSDARVVLVPVTHPEGMTRVNVTKCHFTVWSADMEKLLFSSSPL